MIVTLPKKTHLSKYESWIEISETPFFSFHNLNEALSKPKYYIFFFF